MIVTAASASGVIPSAQPPRPYNRVTLALSPSTRLGVYEVTAQIGAGGMGEVYRATDSNLKRSVAIKVLPAAVASDAGRLARFQREAEVLAALNHPNIAAIYGLERTPDFTALVMELVEGDDLSQRIARGAIPLDEALPIAKQIAEALETAHERGIVHRDLKPANIKVREDGTVKVLDFGLAKALSPDGPAESPDAMNSPTITAHATQLGVILGTAAYMAPEQAKGKPVDRRADIWAFGVVLYEMLAGRRAYKAEDVSDTLAAVLTREVDWKALPQAVPPRLHALLRDCLVRDPKQRLRDIGDARRVLDQIISGAPDPTAAIALARLDGRPGTRVRLPWVVAVLLTIGGIAFGITKVGWQQKPLPPPFEAMKMMKVTSNGKATRAVISPDGKQVVYVIDDGGRRSLWLRHVATATDVQLAAPADVVYFSLTISPDGSFLYYAFGGTTIRNRALYRMPVLGGNPRKLIDDIGSPIGFSPDGQQIAFVRSGEQDSALMIANADGTGERRIALRAGATSFGNFFEGGIAWSPDSKRIASIAHTRDSAGQFQNVVEVTIEDGTERLLTAQRWYQIQRIAWLSDGRGLLLTAAEKASDFGAKQIWYLSYPAGEAHKITNDLNDYANISLNADSSVLVTVQQDTATNIWVAPNGEASRATQVPSVSSKLDGVDGVTWTPDGRIVYHSRAAGKEAIWIMEADGKDRRQLTSGDTVDFFPSVSRDGRYVVFNSERTGARGIWRMDIDGSNPKRLVQGSNPTATAEWVIYHAQGALWKLPIDGGEPVQLSKNALRCAASPGGKLVACSLEAPGAPAKLAIIPLEGDSPAKVFDAEFDLPARIRWTPDGRAVTYVARENGIADIWSQNIDGGTPKQLTNFKSDQIFSFDWSRDNTLAISQGRVMSDVVLITNAQ